MRKAITKTILLLITGFVPLLCAAQNYGEVTFGYDANGNRVSRSVQIIENERDGQGRGETYLCEVKETLGEAHVRLYPNPTSAQFNVSVEGDGYGRAQAVLYTINGEVLEVGTVIDGFAEFDLTGRSPGIYVVKLTVNGTLKVWKILKN